MTSPTPEQREAAAKWLKRAGELGAIGSFSLRPVSAIDELAAHLAERERVAVARERERCAKIVQAELDKLGGRWSLDSAYLRQAIAAIRAEKGDANG